MTLTPADWAGPRFTKQLTAKLGAAARAAHRLPPLVGVSADLPGIALPHGTAAAGARRQAAAVGRVLRAAGVNLVLAPAADVGTPGGPLAAQAVANTPGAVTHVVVAALQGFRRADTIAAVGHFPGQGRSPRRACARRPSASSRSSGRTTSFTEPPLGLRTKHATVSGGSASDAEESPVSTTRLSALDASFLEVESATAHMHVGWAATFTAPNDAQRPNFDELLHHIAARIGRAPRYRQRLAHVPFGVHEPEWTDHDEFDAAEHVRASDAERLDELVADVLSRPLARDRPLWELWIADRLADGRIGMVGKAHHCMVDGIAAVELSTMLLDPEEHPRSAEPDGWRASPTPGPVTLLGRGLIDRAREQLDLVRAPLGALTSPGRLLSVPGHAVRTAQAVGDALVPSPSETPFNEPSSPHRHLATLRRPLADLRRVKSRFGVTVNDVVLAERLDAAISELLDLL